MLLKKIELRLPKPLIKLPVGPALITVIVSIWALKTFSKIPGGKKTLKIKKPNKKPTKSHKRIKIPACQGQEGCCQKKDPGSPVYYRHPHTDPAGQDSA